MKKLFELQTNLTNYAYPLVKIIVSVLIILFSIFRNNLFVITSKPLNILITVICCVATVSSILCIYIAVPELFYVYKNKKAKHTKFRDMSTVPFDFEQIVCLVKDNDIIEFEIMVNEDVIKVGASSDCKVGSSVFFDKRFYVGKDEYLAVEKFKEELLRFTIDGKINVITIDGVKAEKW